MPDIIHALQSGTMSLWLFIPTAILLGALHGLEPGHSKTMMAAFIVAIRGTVGQAVLLGLAAAISHSLIIWVLAALALHFGSQCDVSAPCGRLKRGRHIGLPPTNWARGRHIGLPLLIGLAAGHDVF